MKNKMKLGNATLAVLKALDTSEYGEYLVDQAWQFSVKEHADLSDYAFGGAVSALKRKGLIKYEAASEKASDCCSMRESAGLSITRAGYDALTATGYVPRKKFWADLVESAPLAA